MRRKRQSKALESAVGSSHVAAAAAQFDSAGAALKLSPKAAANAATKVTADDYEFESPSDDFKSLYLQHVPTLPIPSPHPFDETNF